MTNETVANGPTPGVASASEGESSEKDEIISDWETSYIGWVNAAIAHIQKTEYAEALPYLDLCLDKANNNNVNGNTKNSLLHEGMDQVSLLEKRCFINMKLRRYEKVPDDVKRILGPNPRHKIAYKCLVAAYCKLNMLKSVREAIKLWEKMSPKDLEMMASRTRVLSMVEAVDNGIESGGAFSKVEEVLGLKYDWLLRKKLVDSTWKHRPCPLVGSEQLALCLQYRFGHCSLGERCTDAHSEEELKEWKQRRALWNSSKDDASSTQADTWTRYMHSISSEIDNLRVCPRPDNWEVKSGIHITSQAPLKRQITSLLKPHVFDFQLKSNMYRLNHISLFDDLHRHYFKISEVYCSSHETKISLLERDAEDCSDVSDQLVNLPATLTHSEGLGYNYSVEITFETTVFGTFKQIIVFDFIKTRLEDGNEKNIVPEALKVIRELNVDAVLSDDAQPNRRGPTPLQGQTNDQNQNGKDQNERKKAELGARSRSKILEKSRTWNFGNSEIVDSFTGNKVCSTKVGFALINGRVNPSPEPSNSDQDILTKDNYKDKMRSFLTQEERARQEILSKYNILAQLSLTANYEMKSAGKEGTMQYAREGTLFARLVLFRDVSEDTAVGRLILRNCNYVLISKDENIRAAEESGLKPKVYLCPVMEKTRNVMYFELGNAICEDLGLGNSDTALFQVQFQLDRTTFIQQKRVIDLMKPIHLDLLFPDFSEEFKIPWNPIKQWNPIVENDEFRLNPKQKEALIAVTCKDVTPPILIIGPFGTGKTFTLAQCIKTSLLQQKTRILVCTHSNSAADLYVKEYLHPLTNEIEAAKPLRIYFELRNLATVHPIVQKYCKIEKGRFVMPSKEEILAHRIIVVTLSTSFDLVNLKLDEETFSHILLDEAAQAMESEAVTPLLAAGKNTKLVLAGDYMQLSPELFSSSRHFQVSLLERLHCVYKEDNPCKIMLSENYRSHQAIIQFASDTFYKKNLKCGKLQPTHGSYYPLTFFCARGEDIQDKDSNSYYNMAEVYEVSDKVSEVVSSWPESWGDWRDEGAIGVLTVYPDQVARIRSKLRSRGLGSVSVERVLNVQGKQFRAIFISTVRTSKPWVHILPGNVSQEVDLGFLSNAKLLNTALTRAQSLVAVVGDPVSLCSLGKCRTLWKDFIEHCNENKSLYGISYSQLKQSILGTELRFTWGLNPLANDFEPTPPGLPKWRKADIEDEINSDEDISDGRISSKIEAEAENLPNINRIDFNPPKTPEPESLPGGSESSKEQEHVELLKSQDSDPHIETVTSTSVPVHQPLIPPAPYSWKPAKEQPGQSFRFAAALPPPNRPRPQLQYFPPFTPHPYTPPFLERCQFSPGPPPMFNPYLAAPPYYHPPHIPNWGYQPPGSVRFPLRSNVDLTTAQLSGVPLQLVYQGQRPPQLPPDQGFPPFQANAPNVFGPAHFPPLQVTPAVPVQSFTPEELVTIKRALECYAMDPGNNVPHNGIEPDNENLHQKLSIATCVRAHHPVNNRPNWRMTPQTHISGGPCSCCVPRNPAMGRITSSALHHGSPGQLGFNPLQAQIRFAPPVARDRSSNAIIPIIRSPPERERRTPVLSSASLVSQQQVASRADPSSSRSYANVARTPQHNSNSEASINAGTTLECQSRTTIASVPKPSASISANITKSVKPKSDIAPLMSVPIPIKLEIQSTPTSKSNSKQSNKPTAKGKKSQKKK